MNKIVMIENRPQETKQSPGADRRPFGPRRRPLRTGLVLVLAVYGLFFLVAEGRTPKPNILLITIDTLRADRLGSSGNTDGLTPNMDALAERGAVFLSAFAHTPTTLPSHANILLGLVPPAHGVHANSNFIVPEEAATLAEHLKKEGYATAAFVGAYPLDSRFGLNQGFDVYDDDYGSQSRRGSSYYVERKAEDVVSRALAWLKGRGRPWFLWIHCFDPHDPYDPPSPYRETYAGRLYDGEVAYVDAELGRLTSFLEKSGRFKDTVIVLTGDHGESLGEHGESTHAYFAYNATLRIPLIIVTPDARPARITDMASHIDIFPTVCEAAKIKAPRGLQGISLTPALGGRRLPERAHYFESLYPYYNRGWAPLRGFIEAGKKYIDSPIPELYDLVRDFHEQNNLAEQEALDPHRKRLAELTARLSRDSGGRAQRGSDAESLKKLSSLGYIAGAFRPKKSYGPEDDIKTMLPYHNRVLVARNVGQSGKRAEAVRLLKEIITERPDMDIAYSNLAVFYKDDGRLKEALLVLEEGIRNIPGNFSLFSTHLNFLTLAGRPEEVIRAFTESDIREIEYDPEVWNYLAGALINQGRFEEAREAFEKAVAIDPGFATTYVNRGAAAVAQFVASKEQNLAANAERDLKTALEKDEANITALNGLGVLYRLTGRFEESVENLEKALDLEPGFDWALYNLGMTFRDSGAYERALKAFEEYGRRQKGRLTAAEERRLRELIEECRSKRSSPPAP